MMRQRSLLLMIGLSLALLPLAARSQPGGGASDLVRYRTKDGTEVTKSGEIKESPGGLEITSGGKKTAISARDIVVVYYGSLAGVEEKARQEMPQIDAKGGPEALARYSDLLKAAIAAGGDERSKRHLEYKVAMGSAKVAATKTGDEFKTEAAAAVEKLIAVASQHTKSWELWPAARTAARLQAELGAFNPAAATLANLAKTEGLPASLRNEANFAQAEMLFRSGSVLGAEQTIAKLTDLSPGQKSRVALLQAAIKGARDKADPAKVQAAATAITEMIDKLTDSTGKAAGHNLLADLYMMANQPAEAKWQCLWVEAVHNDDPDETLKAIGRLCEIFDKLGDKERAAAYREKLVRAKTS